MLLPAFALFYQVENAVALTALVHFINGVFKLSLVWRNLNWNIVFRFGLPALVASFLGASILLRLALSKPIFSYAIAQHQFSVVPAKLIVGTLLLIFVIAELNSRFRSLTVPEKFLPFGGFVSGFFGGLAGMQGALRSIFLSKAGLSKEQFIATGAGIAFMIDAARLFVYSSIDFSSEVSKNGTVLAAAVLAALAGSLLGKRYLKSVTLESVQRLVATLLLLVAVGLISGAL
jgi:uncharacterized protein